MIHVVSRYIFLACGLLIFSGLSQAQSFKPLEASNPTLTAQNQNWNYNMGYRFIAENNGDVLALGGRWASGVSATVRLYTYPAGAVIGSATLNGSGTTFSYSTLGSPVALTAGNTYVVAVRLTGNSSGCYSTGQTYPESYGGLQILGSTYLAASNAVPTNLITNTMYGQADLEFQPCSYAGDISSSANSIIEGSSVTLNLVNNVGNIKWQKSTDNVNFNDIPGALGTQYITPGLFNDTYFRSIVTSGSCADTSNSFKVEVLDPEYPLRVNNPAITGQNLNWNYNMGYRFSPTKDGQITELGGRWTEGIVHTVRLYSYPSGNVLASASVTGSLNWSYQSISPLTVSKDSTYFVAVRLDGQNSGLYSSMSTPLTEAGIEIISAGYVAGANTMPTNNITNNMYGQADVKFVPCVSAGLLVAAEASISIYDSTDIYVVGNSGSVSWQSSTDGINFTTVSAGVDTLGTGKLTVSTFYRTIISGGCADDTSNVLQVNVTDPSYVLQSASQTLTGQNNNWNYNMGYRFTALANGQVEELGGRWRSGITHTVRLYAYPAGTQLAAANVTGDGTNWVYSSISPVNLTLGQQYVVAVRLDGQASGMIGTLTTPLPYTENQIEITTFSFLNASNAMPTNSTATNYGQADMKFTPCVYAGEAFISDTLICPLGSIDLELKNSVGNIQWQSSTDNVNFTNIAGAVDTIRQVNSININTYFRAILSDACGFDTSNVVYVNVSGSGSQNGVWTAAAGTSWSDPCNWENGQVPMSGDSVFIIGTMAAPVGVPSLDLAYLELNNPNGLVLSNNLQIQKELKLLNGYLNIGNNRLTLDTGVIVNNSGSVSFIRTGASGSIRLTYNNTTGGSRSIPIGDATTYTPINLNLTSGSLSLGAYIEITNISSTQSNAVGPGNYLQRYWTLTSSGVTAPIYNITIQYDESDVFGSETLMRTKLYNGSSFIDFGLVNSVDNELLANSVNTFGDFTAFDQQAIESITTGNWNSGTTWLGGISPGINDQALINSGHTVSFTALTNIGGLTINSGGTLNCQNFDAVFRRSLDNNGTILGAINFEFNGSQSQAIQTNNNLELEVLTIDNSNGVSLTNGQIDIGTRLDIVTGNFDTGDSVTLKSTSGSTANLGAVLGSISGQMEVQRYVDGMGSNVGWRHIGSPFQSSSLNDFKYNATTHPGGLYLYGFPGSNQSFSWANAYSFNEGTAGNATFSDGWTSPTNASNSISYNVPYTVYTGGSNFPAFDFRIRGYVNSGDVTISNLTFTNSLGWHLIGNPYPSSIDWSAVGKTNVAAIGYVYSETAGGYIATNLLTQTNLIASYQAFFIRVTNGTNSIAFQENDKTNTNASFQKSLKHLDRLGMRLTNISSSRFNIGAIDWNDSATVNFDNDFDAYKLYNPWPLPNLAISFEEDSLETQVNTVPSNLGYHYFRLGTYSPIPGNFELDFTGARKDEVCMILEDLVLDSLVDLSTDSNYQFYLDTSYHSPRFILHVSNFTKSVEKENISCYHLNDGKIEVELDPVNTYNLRLFDATNGLVEEKLNTQNYGLFDSLSAQVYTLKIESDADLCNHEEQLIELFEPIEVIANFTSPDAHLISLGGVQFTNQSIGASDFQWDFGDGEGSNQVSPSHVYADTGVYQVRLTSREDGCIDEFTKPIVVSSAPDSTIGYEELITPILRYSFMNGELSVESEENSLISIQLLDMQGKLVFERKQLTGHGYETSVNLPKAIYLLRVVHEKGQQSFKLTSQ